MSSPLTQVGLLLIQTLFGLYMLIVMLRFLLQLVRADFYNPISQFIVKATNPLLVPMRRVIPGFGGIDFSSLLLAYMVQLIALVLIMLILGGPLKPPLLLVWSLFGVAGMMVSVYFWGLLLVVILSWIAPGSPNPAVMLINQIINPMMEPIRKRMPDMGGIDLSPLIALLILQIVRILIDYFGQSVAVPHQVIFGI